MAKEYILSLVIIVLFLFSGCESFKQEDIKSDTLRIGFIGPLSGEYAGMGTSNLKSIELASKDYGDIEVFAQDSKFNPKDGINAYKKLRDINNIDCLIVLSTPVIEGLKPLIQKDKMPTIVIAQDMDASRDFVYHMAHSIFLPYRDLGSFLQKKNNSVFIVENTAWANEIVENFREGYGQEAKVMYYEKDDDPATILAKLKNAGYKTFSIDGTVSGLIGFYKKIDELRLDDDIEHVLNYNEVGNLKAGSFKDKINDDFFEGKVVVTINQSSSKDYRRRYEQEYNQTMPFFADFGYDAVSLFVMVDPRVKDWDSRMLNYSFKGVTGDVEWDEVGDRVPRIVKGVIRDGLFEREDVFVE